MKEWALPKTMTRSCRDQPLSAVWASSDTQFDASAFEIDTEAGLWPVESSGYARSKIVAAIDGATEIVCLASFLFSDVSIRDALLRAAGRGIRCYLLTMSEQHLQKDAERETEFAQKVIEEHKATLDTLAGHVLVRTALHLHSKFVVVDPLDRARARGLLSTANLTTEALSRNVELVVETTGDVVRALFDQFRLGFWSESEHELMEPGRLEAIGQAGRRKIPAPQSPGLPITAGGTQGLKAALLDLVRDARNELWLSTYNLSAQHEVAQALLARVREGLRVRVFVRARIPNMAAAIEFARAGAEVYSHPYLHAKAVLTRSAGKLRGLVMTANVESLGLDTGFETGLLLGERQCGVLGSLFEKWTGFDRLRLEITRGQVEGPCLVWDGRELQKAQAGGSREMDLGEVEAKSITDMENTAPATFPDLSVSNPLALPHEITYRWTVVPPALPKAARRLKTDSQLAVYQWKDTKYVVAPSPDRLEESLRLGAELGARVVVQRAP